MERIKSLKIKEDKISNSKMAIVVICLKIAENHSLTFASVDQLKKAVRPEFLDYRSEELNLWVRQKTATVRGNQPVHRFDTAFSFAMQGLRHAKYIIPNTDGQKSQYVAPHTQELFKRSPAEIISILNKAWRERDPIANKWNNIKNEIQKALCINTTTGTYTAQETKKSIWFRLHDLIEESIPHRVIKTAINNGNALIVYPKEESLCMHKYFYEYFCLNLCNLYGHYSSEKLNRAGDISIKSALNLMKTLKINDEEYFSQFPVKDRWLLESSMHKFRQVDRITSNLDELYKKILPFRNNMLVHTNAKNHNFDYPEWQVLFDFSIELCKAFHFICSFVFGLGLSCSFLETKPDFMKDYVLNWVNINQADYYKYFAQVKDKIGHEFGGLPGTGFYFDDKTA